MKTFINCTLQNKSVLSNNRHHCGKEAPVAALRVCLERRLAANQCKGFLTDHLHPVMKHFYPDGSGLVQEDTAPTYRARGLIELFDKSDHGVHLLWPSQPPDLKPSGRS